MGAFRSFFNLLSIFSIGRINAAFQMSVGHCSHRGFYIRAGRGDCIVGSESQSYPWRQKSKRLHRPLKLPFGLPIGLVQILVGDIPHLHGQPCVLHSTGGVMDGTRRFIEQLPKIGDVGELSIMGERRCQPLALSDQALPSCVDRDSGEPTGGKQGRAGRDGCNPLGACDNEHPATLDQLADAGQSI